MSLRRLLRAPLLHFALLGTLLSGVLRLLPEPPPPALSVDAGFVERVRAGWQRDSGRPPRPHELDAALRQALDEEVLVREALRLRLDERDPVARERLLRNLRFADPHDASADPAALLRRARALGMAREDLVVRRRLVQVMEQRLVGGIRIDRAAVRDYLARHPQRYGLQERLGWRHVFASAQDGETSEAERRQREQLLHWRARIEQGVDPATLGEPFLLGRERAPATRAELARTFGADFSEALAAAPLGHWIGPLRSPYGWHLVQLTRRQAAGAVEPDESLMRAAAYAWLAEREAVHLREAMADLRQRYGVAGLERQLAGAGTS